MTTTTAGELAELEDLAELVDELEDLQDQGDDVDELADLPAELSWMRLLPDDMRVSPDYVAAHMARLEGGARHALVARKLADAERALTAGALAVDVDPDELLAIAADVTSWQAIAARIPAVRPPVAEDEATAAVLGLRIPDLSAGVPPLAALDLIHYVEAHAGAAASMAPPLTSSGDVEVIELYQRACAAAANLETAAEVFRAPLGAADIRSRVEAWHAWLPTAQRHATAMEQLRILVGIADRARVTEGRAHRCPQWAGATCAGDPTHPRIRWTLEAAAAGRLPHRPVRRAGR